MDGSGIGRDGVYVEEVGSGPPVVLLHSYFCSGEMWRAQVGPLAERHRVLNVDLPGHGRSAPVDVPIDLDRLARLVHGLLAERGATPAAWCGLSIGGMIALRAARMHPQGVSALALLDTDAGGERLVGRLKYRAMVTGVRLLGLRPFLSEISRMMFGRTARRERPELVRRWRGEFARMHVPSALRYARALIARPSILDRLGGISRPALVLVGAEDAALPPRCSEAIHRALPGSERIVLEGTGHLSALERPEAVTDALLSFLGRAHAAASRV